MDGGGAIDRLLGHGKILQQNAILCESMGSGGRELRWMVAWGDYVEKIEAWPALLKHIGHLNCECD